MDFMKLFACHYQEEKIFWHIYCCFVIMLKLWSLKMCYAVWSFMIYLQLPFILFLHFHDLFKREEFIINKLKKSNTKKPGEKNLLSKCPVCYWEENISKHIEYPYALTVLSTVPYKIIPYIEPIFFSVQVSKKVLRNYAFSCVELHLRFHHHDPQVLLLTFIS